MSSYVIPKTQYRSRPTFHRIMPTVCKHIWRIKATLYSVYCGEYFAEDVTITVFTDTHNVNMTRYTNGTSYDVTLQTKDFNTVLPTSDKPTKYNKHLISEYVRRVLNNKCA